MPTSRSEHMKWCKTRALEVLDSGDIPGALASMGSDLGMHPDTKDHCGIQLGMGLLVIGNLKTDAQMRKFIVDFA